MEIVSYQQTINSKQRGQLKVLVISDGLLSETESKFEVEFLR